MDQLKRQRQIQGLSQTTLAQRSGLSLATVQNLEAGRANPELHTLTALADSLGLTLELRPKSISLDELIPYGIPLLGSSPAFAIQPDAIGLIDKLNSVGPLLAGSILSHREVLALMGLLSALHDHYRSHWDKIDGSLKAWKVRHKVTGAVIKLRRIALSNLAEYL